MLENDPTPAFQVGQSVIIERPVIITDSFINPPQFPHGIYYKVSVNETGREMILVFAEQDLAVPDYRKHLAYQLRKAGLSFETSLPFVIGQFCAQHGFPKCPYLSLNKRLEWIRGYHSQRLQLA